MLLNGRQLGLDEVINIQGNRTNRGARISVSPVHKVKLSYVGRFTRRQKTLCANLYDKGISIDFGNHLPHLILACVIGSIIGQFIVPLSESG